MSRSKGGEEVEMEGEEKKGSNGFIVRQRKEKEKKLHPNH